MKIYFQWKNSCHSRCHAIFRRGSVGFGRSERFDGERSHDDRQRTRLWPRKSRLWTFKLTPTLRRSQSGFYFCGL